MYAIEAKKADAAKYLIELGADASAADNAGRTALDYANAYGLVQLIGNISADEAGTTDAYGNTPLHQACHNGQSEVVKAMLASGKCNINARNDGMFTPLCTAAEDDNLLIAELLLDAGADANINGEEGNTPLHYAANNGNERLVKKLIACGAKLDERNESGETALILAAHGGFNYVVGALIDGGADVTVADLDGHTALYYATEAGYNDIVEKLIIAGAEN